MPTDPDILRRMRAAWSTIDDWLVENAPAIYEELRPGVSEERLDEVEAKVGFALDPALRALYRVHDGETSLGVPFEGYSWYSLEDALKWWPGNSAYEHEPDVIEEFSKAVSCDPPGAVQLTFDNPGWIPFATDSTNQLFVDHAPGPNGARGQVSRYGRSDWESPREVLAPSILTLIERMTIDLHADRFEFDEEGWEFERCDDVSLAEIIEEFDERGVSADAIERRLIERLAESPGGVFENFVVLLTVSGAIDRFAARRDDRSFESLMDALRSFASQAKE